jgi:hypothetical protein
MSQHKRKQRTANTGFALYVRRNTMKLSLVIFISILVSSSGLAQDCEFLDRWFLGFPVLEKDPSLYEYGITNSHFKVIGLGNDSSSLFLLDSLHWDKVVPKDFPILSNEIDSALIKISLDYTSTTGIDNPRRHYSGPSRIVTVEYFLKSSDTISAWVDRIIRQALRFKYFSESVTPKLGAEEYSSGEILFSDNRKRYRMLEVYMNVYVTGKTSLLVSYEVER